jgi:uncharacterized RDD family membrane protein YckC
MQDDILDEEVISVSGPDGLNLASPTRRFFTYLIDIVILYVIIIGALVYMMYENEITEDSTGAINLIFFGLLFLYYAGMEAAFGKTIGKMVTKTRVVDPNGERITLSAAAIRSLCRLVPFEAFSIWSEGNVMWHDRWASTRVIHE